MRLPALIHGLAALLVMVLIGCSATRYNRADAVPPLIPPGGGTSSLSPEDAQAGRTLYIAKCARCHKFHDPARYADREWRTWMDKMSRKAKLKPDQEELLTRYLDAFRSDSRESREATDGHR